MDNSRRILDRNLKGYEIILFINRKSHIIALLILFVRFFPRLPTFFFFPNSLTENYFRTFSVPIPRIPGKRQFHSREPHSQVRQGFPSLPLHLFIMQCWSLSGRIGWNNWIMIPCHFFKRDNFLLCIYPVINVPTGGFLFPKIKDEILF